MSKDTGGSAGLETEEKKSGFVFAQVIILKGMRPLSCARFGDSVFGIGIEHPS